MYEINNFYSFSAKFSNIPICVKCLEVNMDNYQNLIKGNFNDFNFPLIFKQISGKKLTDILNPSMISMYIISDKLKLLLEENNITGWKSYPAVINGKNGEQVKGYNGFSVTGKCGTTDYSKSKIIQKRYVENGPLVDKYLGKYIGFDKWDGSDIFIEENTLRIIITKKVADIFKKNKITNYEITNLAEYEVDVAAIENYR